MDFSFSSPHHDTCRSQRIARELTTSGNGRRSQTGRLFVSLASPLRWPFFDGRRPRNRINSGFLLTSLKRCLACFAPQFHPFGRIDADALQHIDFAIPAFTAQRLRLFARLGKGGVLHLRLIHPADIDHPKLMFLNWSLSDDLHRGLFDFGCRAHNFRAQKTATRRVNRSGDSSERTKSCL